MNFAENNKNLLSLEDFIALLPTHVYQKDVNGVYLQCSDLQAQVFGYQKGRDIVGKTDYDLLEKSQADSIRDNDIRAMETKKILIIEESATLSSGIKAIYLSKKIPLLDDNGESIGILGISTDITLNKQKEENALLEVKNIAEAKEKNITNYYENLIALIPANVYWMNRNNIFLGCNDQQAKLAGLKSRREIVGKSNYDMPWKDQADVLNALNNKVMETGIPHIAEENAEMIFGDTAKEGVFLSHKIPLFDDNGVVIGLLGVSLDITEHKKAEEYRIKHEAAQKVINFSNLVAGSIAHELRLPLAGIKQQMETLKGMDSGKIPKKERDDFTENMADRIIKTVDATTYVINDMLKKVRSFATGEIHHNEFEEISITSDVENLLNTYPFQNNESELVKTSYGARFKYLGDKNLTAHVLSNLMKNALHAIAETDKTDADITIETKTENDFNLLIFRDTATGVTKDFLGKIFDQFETKKDIHGGSGLGLAFCKKTMKDCYDGDIICNSELGKYTEFVLSFPKIKRDESLMTQEKR